MRRLKVGILELIVSTAALHNQLRPSFWAELAIKQQFYSIMPQAVSVWARAKGHDVYYATYFGLGRPEDKLPADLDLVFLATPTQHALLAYALSAICHARGAKVVLAGPHARAYPEDCARHADIVVTECDRQVVEDILAGHVDPGSALRSARPLADLPMVEDREAEIRAAAFIGGRQQKTTTISLISSLGCPYACDFCSEWSTPYSAFSTDRLMRELDIIAERYPGALIAFHDPNFGVRFDQTLAAFERRDRPVRNRFVMEASLSLLSPARLSRLRAAGCLMVAPGVESFADYSQKSRTTLATGEAKYAAVSARMREIEAEIPTVQANLILGVDADAGDEPFALARRFIAEHPTVWTNVNIPIPFGRTPFADRVLGEGRLVPSLPFAFYTAPYLAMRPMHYGFDDYLARLSQVYADLVSLRLLALRMARLPDLLARGVVLARTAALRVEFAELMAFREALLRESDMRRFYSGESRRLPDFLRRRLLDRLGRYVDVLPDERQHDWAPIAAGQEAIRAT
jgi:hypothetical protein